MRNVVIVGAGPAGLTAAFELIKQDCNIVVLEQDPTYVGGISRTVMYKDFRFDIGGHRFFSKNTEISCWWRDRLPQDFISVRRQSRILYGKKMYDYPLRPGNALRNLGIFTSIHCLLSYLWIRRFPIKSERTFEDWVSNRFGRKLFSLFFKTYTEKVWGIPCSEISADWASQRIKGLSLKDAIINAFRRQPKDGPVIKTLIDSFEYPRLGPGMMWEKTRDALLAAGAQVHMNRKVVEICREENRIKFLRTRDSKGKIEEWRGDDFILTLPLRDTILNQSPGLPMAAQEAARNLKYRDFLTVALIVQGENLFSDNWIYIHDPGVKVGRIQNFNNWSKDMVKRNGVTCLGLEYFCNCNDGIWNMDDEDLIKLAKAESNKIGLVKPELVVDACVVRMEKAYPVYDSQYQTHVSAIKTELDKISNLQVAGRNGMHKYNNQDHSMLTGLLAARNLTARTYDLWRVNTDAEYQEEGENKETGRAVPRPLV